MGAVPSCSTCSSACGKGEQAKEQIESVDIQKPDEPTPKKSNEHSPIDYGVVQTPSEIAMGVTIQCHFPLHALSVKKFATLQRMQQHEHIYNALTCPEERDIVHFISHEWLGFEHPDPDGERLQTMQSIFQAMADGQARTFFAEHEFQALLTGVSMAAAKKVQSVEKKVNERWHFEEEHIQEHVTHGYVWLDYHSIPQEKDTDSFLDAVNSIPYYVNRCNYFWVCAAGAVHQDLKQPRNLQTWAGRGWCRLEDMTNLLCRTLKMPLVVSSRTRIGTYGFVDTAHVLFGRPERSVANGNFTCCLLNHQLPLHDGSFKPIPCDKEAIAPILVEMFQARFDHSIDKAGDAFKRRLLLAIARTMFAGFEDHCPDDFTAWAIPAHEDLESFLERVDFETIDSVDELGNTSVFWATLISHFEVMKDIIRQRPGMLLNKPDHDFTPLMALIHRPLEEMQAALDLDPQAKEPAELNHQTKRGYTVVDRAARLGFHEALQHVLQLGADVNPRRNDNGATPLLSAAESGYPLCCQVLLEYTADIEAVDAKGQTALQLAVSKQCWLGNQALLSRQEVIEVLLEAGADPALLDPQARASMQSLMEDPQVLPVLELRRQVSVPHHLLRSQSPRSIHRNSRFRRNAT
mmetsp:Transcript_55015/g.131121  ORF Transcript_55015/g.131121 Transcript_55015/m.131121 type:complete len:633 (-) Transcript_55015:98-1996(-)